jgi:pentatricopeptide repeat protein
MKAGLTDTAAIDFHHLIQTSLAILISDLESAAYGSNRLALAHRTALEILLREMAAFANGDATGRKAFAIPTGGGKTSAIVAFITALYRLEYEVPLSVAASKVEALCDIYRALIAHGVPVEKIGLKHAVPGASIPSTGAGEFLFQLVTHARVRGGTDFATFGEFKGQPRRVCFYDETLLRSAVFSFTDTDFRQAVAALEPLAQDGNDITLKAAAAYLRRCSDAIHSQAGTLKADPEAVLRGLPVTLPIVDHAHLKLWLEVLRRHASRLMRPDILMGLLDLAREPLHVLTTFQGDAVVSVRQVMPEALRNVLILDASTPIRELVSMDPSIESIALPEFKSFADVEVEQLVAAGGRTAMQGSYGTRSDVAAVSREVVEVIRSALAETPEGSILIYGFLKRGDVDVIARLKDDMTRLGIDPSAVRADGRRCFEFETWGRHEGLNNYAHCETVILVGVLHLRAADIAGSIKGQMLAPE